MTAMLRRASAHLIREARLLASYRAAVALDVVASLLVVVAHLFLARLVDSGDASALAAYRDRGGYFAFSVTGVVLAAFMADLSRAFTEPVRLGQTTGTLEANLLAPGGAWELPTWSALFALLRQSLKLALMLAAGAVLGMPLAGHLVLVPLVLVACALAVAPFGLLGAAWVVTFKRGDPIAWGVGVVSLLAGDVYYPAEVLPDWLRVVGSLLPLKHAVEALRVTALPGSTPAELVAPLGKLAIYPALLGPVSAFTLSVAVARAKRHGTLGEQ
jgi:ABC-2 type transport system permease protein